MFGRPEFDVASSGQSPALQVALGLLSTELERVFVNDLGLGVETIEIRPGGLPGQASSFTTVAVGRQFGDKWFVTGNVGLCVGERSTGFSSRNFGASVEYRFARDWRVQAIAEPAVMFVEPRVGTPGQPAGTLPARCRPALGARVLVRALLIMNPAAARTTATTVRTIESVLRGGGWELEVLATSGPGHARELAEYGVANGVDVVAVFGGDGTTMQAAAALVGTDVALGLLPGGTGNLLAGNLRIPANPVRAAKMLLRSTARPIDLGRITRADGDHYFAVACGAGIDARVMTETPTLLKQQWGMMAYVATTLRLVSQLRCVTFELTVDGEEFQLEAAMLLVANCGEVIPRLVTLGPGISPEDGYLDVVAMHATSFGTGVRAVWDLLRDAPGVYGRDASIGYARGREISVRTPGGPEPVQLDGEPGGTTDFAVSVVPGAVRVMRL